MIVLPISATMMTYMGCCGKTICCGCHHTQLEATDKINEGKAEGELLKESPCPFCRAPLPDPHDDSMIVERWEKRIEKGDAFAMRRLGGAYQDGDFGLPVDHSKAVERVSRAADLGLAEACVDLGSWYYAGRIGL